MLWVWAWDAKKNRFVDRKPKPSAPWAGVAEWLRAAHSLLDEKNVELTHNAD